MGVFGIKGNLKWVTKGILVMDCTVQVKDVDYEWPGCRLWFEKKEERNWNSHVFTFLLSHVLATCALKFLWFGIYLVEIYKFSIISLYY